MLTITVPKRETFDESRSVIIAFPETTIRLEHSLVSLSKWESKWHQPLLGRVGTEEKNDWSPEQMNSYVECMCLTEDLPEGFFDYLPNSVLSEIQTYIGDPQTATTIHDNQPGGGGKRKTITAELIYSWMVGLQIPFSCETWPLQRLLMLIRVLEIQNRPKKSNRVNPKSAASRRRAINAQRRAQYGTNG